MAIDTKQSCSSAIMTRFSVSVLKHDSHWGTQYRGGRRPATYARPSLDGSGKSIPIHASQITGTFFYFFLNVSLSGELLVAFVCFINQQPTLLISAMIKTSLLKAKIFSESVMKAASRCERRRRSNETNYSRFFKVRTRGIIVSCTL